MAETSIEDQITIAEERLVKLKSEIREYETAFEVVRKEDQERDRQLKKREQRLKAGWRSLHQERFNFKEEKKRFYQTRDLQP